MWSARLTEDLEDTVRFRGAAQVNVVSLAQLDRVSAYEAEGWGFEFLTRRQMKICTRCKEEKNLSEFAWKNKAQTKYQGQCHPCRRFTARESYQRNSQHVIDAAVERSKVKRKWFQEYKSTLRCAMCPEDTAVCLDFHHVDPTQKDIELSSLITLGSRKRFKEELKKCVVLCSNCHRKYHGGLFSLLGLV